MGAVALVMNTTWPTNIAGHVDTSPDAVKTLHARVDALDDTLLADVVYEFSGETPAVHGAELAKSGEFGDGKRVQPAERAYRDARSRLHAAVDAMPNFDEDASYYFDGLRWRIVYTEFAHGDISDPWIELQMIDASFICAAPTDGEQFLDSGAVAAAVAVLDEVAETTLKALAGAGFTDAQRQAAEAALTDARNDVLGTAKTIRKALEGVRVAA